MDDAEFKATRERIEKYARIMVEHGVRNFDPKELGSPFELSAEAVAASEKRLDEEERAFVREQIEPLKLNPPRVRCAACRAETIGLCEEHSRQLEFVQEHSPAYLQEWLDESAKRQQEAVAAVATVTLVYPCTKGHGPGSPRWTQVYSAELGEHVGRCSCCDRELVMRERRRRTKPTPEAPEP